ncbi:WD40 repeat domain-containing protein [Tundrisphaera lichenicola]|uniref:WD40 repeat domain-containing protein n=1 Tax=Tundrisphaera lichenicola TaxID=2029860 RepID=UPI003EBE6E26
MLNEYRPRDRTNPACGSPVRVCVFTGSGLAMAGMALVAGVVALMIHDPGVGEAEMPLGRFHRQPSQITALSFAPDGRSLAVGRVDGSLEVQDPTRGRPREFETGSEAPIQSITYSPDGKLLASAGPGSEVKIWDTTTGQPLMTLTGHTGTVCSVAFSLDGKFLASGAIDGRVRLWDLADGQERAILAGHTDKVLGLAFAPDGRALVSSSFDGTIKLWDMADGRERSTLLDERGQRRVYGLAFAPDGRTLAFGLGASKGGDNGRIVLWDFIKGAETARTPGHSSFTTLGFAPDGRTLASAGGDCVVRLWDASTGEDRGILTGHDGFIDSIAFSPDGRTLATGGQDSLLGLYEFDPEDRRTHNL